MRRQRRTSLKKPSRWVEGEHSARLEQEFVEAGGDTESCPFDCPGQIDEQPRIVWDGDYPTIASYTQWLRSQGEFGVGEEE